MARGEYNNAIEAFTTVIKTCERNHILTSKAYIEAHYGRGFATYQHMTAVKGLDESLMYRLAVESLADLTLYHAFADLHKNQFLGVERLVGVLKQATKCLE